MRVKEEEIIQSSTAQTRLLFHDSFEFVTKKVNSKRANRAGARLETF